jgi:hypothetical protein
MDVSESLWSDVKTHPTLTAIGEPRELEFDEDGKLPQL